jgi:formylglycine-generating enzyme required for sulfatase activity
MKRAALVAILAACSNEAPPRPQILLAIDTDAPLVGQIADRPELSGDAAIDTVRVDMLELENRPPYDLRDLVVPEPALWPVTFGIRAPDPPLGRSVRVRIRAFRGRFARRGTLGEKTTLEPPPEVTIERVVDLDLPATGVKKVRVHLSADCFGAPSSFVGDPITCIDGARTSGGARDGLEIVEAIAPTRAGTWPRAFEEPCRTTPAEGRACIPGGFLMMGDVDFGGIANFVIFDSVPLRPARISAFHMDVTEFTVERMRALTRRGFIHDLDTRRAEPFCTWRGPDDPSNDRYPINCLSWDTARRACEAEGGTLPSEAQWEHAARGRGKRYLYPWGDQSAECCTASISRQGFTNAVECDGTGPEPVQSHPPRSLCQGLGDVSRDGVFDLAGSVSEAVLDHAAELTSTCWRYRGVALDPVCVEDQRPARSMRGANWSNGLATGAAPLRRVMTLPSPGAGFRCVYPEPR